MISEFILIFFHLCLGTFAVASTLMVLYSVQNKLRLRNVRIQWRAGKLKGFPLFSTIFLSCILILNIAIYAAGETSQALIAGTYLWLGFMWFISSYLTSKHYITDNGIVKNINEPSQTVAWHQIVDFAEKKNGKGLSYSFVYQKDQSFGKPDKKFYRFELAVPLSKHKKFKKIVSYKLEKRFESNLPFKVDFKRSEG